MSSMFLVLIVFTISIIYCLTLFAILNKTCVQNFFLSFEDIIIDFEKTITN